MFRRRITPLALVPAALAGLLVGSTLSPATYAGAADRHPADPGHGFSSRHDGLAAPGTIDSPRSTDTEPLTAFQMPFPCGQAWYGSSRAGHSPSYRAIDWNRTDDYGAPVAAAAGGTVSVADKTGTTGYGHWIRIDHGNGEQTIYGHLSVVSVTVGQVVQQGDIIGNVGSTGNSTGPHLHFEERADGLVVWPYFDHQRFVMGQTWTSNNCATDAPVTGNFVEGPATEVGIYRRATPSVFEIDRPGTTPKRIRFGIDTDQPIAGDWDGDGLANPGVRTPSTRTFTLRTPAGLTSIVLGGVKDLAITGDWDGDGRTDVGVRRARKPVWLLRMGDGTISRARFGLVADLPITGDWDGDGKTDLGTYDRATSTFTLRLVGADGLAWTAQVPFGTSGDLPVTGDWDGDGRTDVGTWTPSTSTFSQRMPGAGSTPVQIQFAG
jgi:murein DD-endopeptidase MepM/ murein hydrolase activator NlpD